MSAKCTECPLCFEDFDSNTHKPIKLFCCGVVICHCCLDSIANTSLICPWDKKRWLKRNIYSKCEDVTPVELLSQLRDQFTNENVAVTNKPLHLGDGTLRQEYENQIRNISKVHISNSSNQVEDDSKYALALQRLEDEEAQQLANRNAEILEKDTAFIQSISQSSSKDISLKSISEHKSSSSKSVNQLKNSKENLVTKMFERSSNKRHSISSSSSSSSSSYCSTTSTAPLESSKPLNKDLAHVNKSDNILKKRKVVNLGAALEEANWHCTVCTFSNNGLLFECELCSSPRAGRDTLNQQDPVGVEVLLL